MNGMQSPKRQKINPSLESLVLEAQGTVEKLGQIGLLEEQTEQFVSQLAQLIHMKNQIAKIVNLQGMEEKEEGDDKDDGDDTMDGQGKIRERLQSINVSLSRTLERSQGNCSRLNEYLHKYEDICRLDKGPIQGEEWVKEIVAMGHRLGYSAFAPMGYQAGFPLGVFKPPAPQEEHFRFSLLYHHQIQKAAQQQQLQGEKEAEKEQTAAAASQVDAVKAEVVDEEVKEEVASPHQPEQRAESGFDFDFILNADMVDYDEELEESSTDEDG
eukprot:TRINITY_DN5264_c0_g2_i1.p1 TRINITY_DN5264_c0_g2~~TRINITY_DN5264_c0_g2_i1.p1  ORF type:complete len:284 (-),score=73.95 TRINITY_DN5264_c0_g2_i1:474-1283(-)